MSLFGSLQTASNTLQAMQIGLQVTNNNIANANTEGFIRERVIYAPAPVQEFGSVQIGLGVQIEGITQVVDDFLGEQLRNASADRASAEIRNNAYKDLEAILGELSDTDLSTALTSFFGSIEDISGDDLSVRNLARLEGERLAGGIQRIDELAQDLRDSYNDQILGSVERVNHLAEEIQQLNIRITQAEGGSSGGSDAGALRTQRNNIVNELGELIDITVTEQPSGGLSVAVGGEFLVFEGQRREVSAETTTDELGQAVATLQFTDTGSDLDLTRGTVHGLTVARDEVVADFRSDLDEFTKTLIHEFNLIHSNGQGTSGFETLTSTNGVNDTTAALDQAGLAFSPGSGSFNLTVVSADGSEPETTRIDVKLLGFDDDTSLVELAVQINDAPGLSASIDNAGRLTIATDSPDAEFYFSDDTSGVLASLGLNTFFTGSGAESIAVNPALDGIENASKFAASNTGLGAGTGNALSLASLVDAELDSLDGATLFEKYDQVVNELAQNSTVAGSVAEGLAVFEATLEVDFQSISGVNIDEEAIDLIGLQTIYQAAARVITTIQEMLDTLLRL